MSCLQDTKRKAYQNMKFDTFHIKMRDYGLSIGAFCVKLRYRIWFRRRLGQASEGAGGEGGGRVLCVWVAGMQELRVGSARVLCLPGNGLNVLVQLAARRARARPPRTPASLHKLKI